MHDGEENRIGYMKVVGKMVTELEKIPEGVLESEHNSDARTLDGLLGAL